MTIEQLLKSKTHKTESGCWLWTGGVSSNGYGHFRWEGRDVSVHRASAHLYLGLDIKDRELQACHKCDKKTCWNPDHLYVGTAQDNTWDHIDAGGRRKSVCNHGHEMTPANTLTRWNGKRECRECCNLRRRGKYSLTKQIMGYKGPPVDLRSGKVD